MDYLNIDKLQKVNSLARELKSHGLVSDMSDAYGEAQAITNSSSELSFLQKANNAEVLVEEKPAAGAFLKIEEKGESGDSDKALVLRRKLAEAEGRIVSMEEVMMKMQHAMNDAFAQIRELREAQKVQPVQQAPQQQVTVQEVQQQPTQQPVQEAKKENHPRQGQYTSDDVSIDKIFYCGR